MSKSMWFVISIDPGEKKSGVSIIMLSTEYPNKTELLGFVIDNSLVASKIKEYYVKYESICNIMAVIEDIRPYKARMSLQTITTCKFIGELNYRLKCEIGVSTEYVTRGSVKKWVFDNFNGDCIDRIDKKILYLDGYGEKNDRKRYRTKEGLLRKASFHFVDDRVVIATMKRLWNIPTPKPGKRNAYGFSSHSWQALSVGSYFLSLKFGNELLKNCNCFPFPFL